MLGKIINLNQLIKIEGKRKKNSTDYMEAMKVASDKSS